MADIDTRGEGALFSIGQMGRLFDLNVRTLRYYDEIGLLEPEFVNEQTGYRYYSSAQFERLNTIKYLRALDVPIERIAAFFANKDVALMHDIFDEQLEHVKRKQRDLARIERKIRARLAQIDHAVNDALDTPELVEIPPRRIVSLAESFAPDSDLEPLIRDLSRQAKLDDAIFLGKVGVSIGADDLAHRRFEQLSSVFIVVEKADGRKRAGTVLPGGLYAQIRFRGTHRNAAPSYGRLLDFIAERGAQIAGASVETTIIDAGMTSNEDEFVTELQVPVQCRASTPELPL